MKYLVSMHMVAPRDDLDLPGPTVGLVVEVEVDDQGWAGNKARMTVADSIVVDSVTPLG